MELGFTFAFAVVILCAIIVIASLVGSRTVTGTREAFEASIRTHVQVFPVFHAYVTPTVSRERDRFVISVNAIDFVIVEYAGNSANKEGNDFWFGDLGPGVTSLEEAVAFAKELAPLHATRVLWMRPPVDKEEIERIAAAATAAATANANARGIELAPGVFSG